MARISLVFILAVGLMAPTGDSWAATAKPRRIVSMNLCLDQLVLRLAAPQRIASVTYLAANPDVSTSWRAARRHTLNHGRAEEILPMKPDLILSGRYSARAATALLKRLGYRVVDFEPAYSVPAMRKTVRRVAKLLGETARGEAMLKRFDERLKAGTATGKWQPTAALYWARGVTSGRGTLANDIVEAAGYRNLAVQLGMSGTAKLPLEALITKPFDILVIAGAPDAPASLAKEALHHPVIRRIAATKRVVNLPSKYLICGIPQIIEAVERLRRVSHQMPKR